MYQNVSFIYVGNLLFFVTDSEYGGRIIFPSLNLNADPGSKKKSQVANVPTPFSPYKSILGLKSESCQEMPLCTTSKTGTADTLN